MSIGSKLKGEYADFWKS